MSVPLYQAKAEFFRTLGHPARIRILELLSERDHAVHELLEQISIEPSNLSQQLAVLRRTSLVVVRREGGEVTYSISAPEVRDILLSARRILVGLIHVDEEHALAPPIKTARCWPSCHPNRIEPCGATCSCSGAMPAPCCPMQPIGRTHDPDVT